MVFKNIINDNIKFAEINELRKILADKQKHLKINDTDLEHAVRRIYPQSRLSQPTIGRFKDGTQKDIRYTSLFYWNSTLDNLISQKNYEKLATRKGNSSDQNLTK